MHTHETTPIAPQAPEAAQDAVSAANRRSFLKGTALAAGIAATGALSAAAQDISLAETSLKVIPRAVMRVGFDVRSHPTFKDVYRSLEEVLRIAGCPNCGLVGLEATLSLSTHRRRRPVHRAIARILRHNALAHTRLLLCYLSLSRASPSEKSVLPAYS